MNSNQTSKIKSKKYIYTEQDLGEGLLDEGVSYPYILDKTNLQHEVCTDIELKGNFLMKDVPNVQEDLTYEFYC